MKRALSMTVTLSFTLLSVMPVFAAEAADPAKALFEEKCSVCHGFDRPLGVHRTKDAWEATVKRMQSKKPGNFNDDEAKTIIDYLTKVRGPQ